MRRPINTAPAEVNLDQFEGYGSVLESKPSLKVVTARTDLVVK
jgi:hypothetical protein